MSESLIKMNGIIKFEKTDDIILDMKYIIDSSQKSALVLRQEKGLIK